MAQGSALTRLRLLLAAEPTARGCGSSCPWLTPLLLILTAPAHGHLEETSLLGLREPLLVAMAQAAAVVVVLCRRHFRYGARLAPPTAAAHIGKEDEDGGGREEGRWQPGACVELGRYVRGGGRMGLIRVRVRQCGR